MYKLLLCWRYLLTRYLALACIISVMLGVATLIIVNSVMAGFSTKLRDRLHALLSDVVIESVSMDGFANPHWHMKKIMDDPILKDKIVAMTPTMEVFGIFEFKLMSGESITRTVRLVGVDSETRGEVGGFKSYLENQKDAAVVSFAPSEKALQSYLWRNPLAGGMPPQPAAVPFPVPPQAPLPPELMPLPSKAKLLPPVEGLPPSLPLPPPLPGQKLDFSKLPDTPPGVPPEQQTPAQFFPANGQQAAPAPWHLKPSLPHGVIVGNLIAKIRYKSEVPGQPGEERVLLLPGDEVTITTIRGGKPAPVYDQFLVVDYFKSDMSEYDSNYVFVPLSYLQELRGLDDRATSIQVKLKNYDKDSRLVVERLKDIFPKGLYMIDTWEGRQGPLLSAIQIERGILNVLLFLIIAVAGFGILAIFSMIVAEKTRDIGILKALGASNRGIMTIFLAYGLLLGIVGAALGTTIGVTLTQHINDVEKWLSQITGNNVFSRDVYYFSEIPTDIQFWNVVFLNLGAVAIAVFFSVLPALRAAWLHPVRALRYE